MKNDLMLRHPEMYFESLHNELNNFLRDTVMSPMFSNPLNIKKNSIWRPAVEIIQTDENYKIKVQLPGVNKEDIDVKLDNDFMTITAEISEEKEEKEEREKNEKCHTSEFRYGRYQRTISFDQPVKYQDSKAKYKNGVLCITVPKQETEIKKSAHLEIE